MRISDKIKLAAACVAAGAIIGFAVGMMLAARLGAPRNQTVVK